MAIRQVAAFAHLSDADVDALARDLDAIRADVEASLGVRDATYIRRTIRAQRLLDVAARIVIHRSRGRAGWMLGTVALAVAKSIENMEIGHNVGHGQWDWMNDPEIHSNTWEWDMAGLSSQWRYSHNYTHHMFNNVIGVDDDLGFGVLRVSPDQEWKPDYLISPLRNLLLALIFEWGIALHGLHAARDRALEVGGSKGGHELAAKVTRQVGKDYVALPALSGRRWRRTLAANATANILRNLWAYVVIFCGHFPDGAEKFDATVLDDETRGEWYLRQMLGSANFNAGRTMAFMSGNLCYQIEHHLFPDLPSNRLAQIARRVRALCEEYDLPYTTGPLPRQYWQTFRTIHKYALPDRFLKSSRSRECTEGREPQRFTTLSAVSTRV
ncbi:fatty acid desaturase family protein [Mycolicibacterium litorale]|uniref:Fatty acid desaturase n=1 Tax=Mycolicibacterium litorale TaxID=758802 RepID=A0AAD1MRS3_9MYCO|nr:acyl-CoA desaturase [Mycolicibacterium litorale]MCV7413809.1 acyl-CoA desaturase [Mycolicibacterium litorale]TDY03309.1 fatty acid desaturase [Mycolicibacterium litorale]BBY15105.1 fatty acid desaturase [Mycolicibacterium litorale]